jgi:hypothetical protein
MQRYRMHLAANYPEIFDNISNKPLDI